MLNKIFRIFSYCLYNIIYLLSFLFKRNNNIWVFGAWFGKNYSDNSKYLFEYMLKEGKRTAIWIYKDKDFLIKNHISNTEHFAYAYSFEGVYYQLKAGVVFVTHTIYSDLVAYFINTKALKVQLWHGVPIKKIGFDDKFTSSTRRNAQLKSIFFPFLYENYNVMIASSEYDKEIFKNAFLVDEVKITGYPRNDILATKTLISSHNLLGNKIKILYAPTFRCLNSEFDYFKPFGIDFNKLDILLGSYNAILDIKLHPVQVIPLNSINDIKNCKNVTLLDNSHDINSSLTDYQILITDYSSIYIDYLLLDRPIILSYFDIKEYNSKYRESYLDFNSLEANYICNNWSEVLCSLHNLLNNQDFRYIGNSKNRFHHYNSSGDTYCSNVYKLVESKIKGV